MLHYFWWNQSYGLGHFLIYQAKACYLSSNYVALFLMKSILWIGPFCLGRGWIYLIFLDLSKEQEQEHVMIKRPVRVGALLPFPFPLWSCCDLKSSGHQDSLINTKYLPLESRILYNSSWTHSPVNPDSRCCSTLAEIGGRESPQRGNTQTETEQRERRRNTKRRESREETQRG